MDKNNNNEPIKVQVVKGSPFPTSYDNISEAGLGGLHKPEVVKPTPKKKMLTKRADKARVVKTLGADKGGVQTVDEKYAPNPNITSTRKDSFE